MVRIQIPPASNWKFLTKIGEQDFDLLMAKAVESNAKYHHWDELVYRVPKSLDTEQLWSLMKFLRQNSLATVNLGNLRFSFTVTNELQAILYQLDHKMMQILQSTELADKKRRARLKVSSLMEEAIASSQLEGADTTTKAAKKMLMEQRAPHNHSELMIANNYRAMQYLQEIKDEPLSRDLICRVHAKITAGTLGNQDYEGQFRNNVDLFMRWWLVNDFPS